MAILKCGNGQVVTWCIGHLLEQAQPDIYDSRYARWNLNDLPIVPEKWQLQPKPSVTKQLNVIKRLLRRRRGGYPRRRPGQRRAAAGGRSTRLPTAGAGEASAGAALSD
ncbi:hypothetical protein LNO89_04585 [Klebsiella pneumoniae subsp. pneumoniae]|nr:hypothetical protein [Klebsiella pneumoniae subsp. pneumoniae]